jgi:hypothetical protein
MENQRRCSSRSIRSRPCSTTDDEWSPQGLSHIRSTALVDRLAGADAGAPVRSRSPLERLGGSAADAVARGCDGLDVRAADDRARPIERLLQRTVCLLGGGGHAFAGIAELRDGRIPTARESFRRFQQAAPGLRDSSCEWPDSNRHGFTHWYLKPARLPIPPHSRWKGTDATDRRRAQVPPAGLAQR